ncbi:MAG: sensor histidine kinase [Candidatus Limnocylindria bacterium]
MIAQRPPPATHATWVDLLIAVAVTAAEIAGTLILVHAVGSDRSLDLIGFALLVANAAPIAVRNRHPIPVLLAVAATTLVYTWLGYPGGFYTIAMAFAIWAAVAAGHRIVAIGVGALVVGAVVVASYVLSAGHATDAGAPIWLGGWLVASFVLGEVSRGRRRYLEQAEQRALDAERSREEEARRRAGEERLRIARELHDVLAHNISIINVQAGVAVHLLDRQPEQARTALVAISQASKEAMRELRATLGVLRQVDEEDPRTPTPGLAELGELVDRARSAGVSVEVEVQGNDRSLPAATDLAAYRIIQESLTNVARHAAAAHVTLSIRHGRGDVEIHVEDDGIGVAGGGPPRAGNGLTGMRERATAAGGELEAGPRPEGGFRVWARLPLGETS